MFIVIGSGSVGQEINNNLDIDFVCDPLNMLLRIYCNFIIDKHKRELYKLLTFCARKCENVEQHNGKELFLNMLL